MLLLFRAHQLNPGPEVIKIFMLNSAEHEILNAHIKFQEIQLLTASDKLIMLFFMLINV